MSNTSIWLRDRTLSGATIPSQSGPGRNGNEGLLHISQSSKPGTLPSDCLMTYPGDLMGEPHPRADMHLEYSIAPSDLASFRKGWINTHNRKIKNNKYRQKKEI